MRSISLCNKGFSLPEILVAMALMGGISLVTMKLVDEQKSNEAYIKSNTEIQKAVAILKNTLNDPENCRSILAGQNLTAAGVNLTGPLRIPLKTSPTERREILRPNTNYNGFQTLGIRLLRPAGAAPNTAIMEVDFLNKKRNMKLWGSVNDAVDPNDIKTERIPLLVTPDSSGNVVTDCGPVVSDAADTAKEKFCKSLGGAATWTDGVAGAPGTCEFNEVKCGYGEVLVQMTSLGGAICEPIINHIDLNQLFLEDTCTTNGSYRIIDDGGKLRIDCP